jgi:hypothetical protein
LLTYCAGTSAALVTWIVEHLNEEHVAALEWSTPVSRPMSANLRRCERVRR